MGKVNGYAIVPGANEVNYRTAIDLGLAWDGDLGASMRRLAGWNAFQRTVLGQWGLPRERRGTILRSDNPFRRCPDRFDGWESAYNDHKED